MAQKNEAPALIVAFLITVGLLGGGMWWLLRQVNLDFSKSIGNTSQRTDPTNSKPVAEFSPPTGQQFESYAQVPNVPTGLFNYGGSTSWAPVRGQIDPLIQTVFPRFQLRYTEPPGNQSGSSVGIRMLLDDQLAIAQSSRPLTDEEYQQAKQRGFTLKQIPVALEGIAIAVHPNLDIAGLTINQIKAIYTGQLTNWRDLGGPNLPITPYSRRDGGGTVEFFEEAVLGNQAKSRSVQLVSNTTQALRELSKNLGGIYYASAPEIVGQCSIKPIALGRETSNLVAPYEGALVNSSQCPQKRNQVDVAAIKNGRYPLTRSLFIIIKQDGSSVQQAGEAYTNLLLTRQGQEALQQLGFVSIR